VIYALAFAVALCLLVVIAVMAYVWTVAQEMRRNTRDTDAVRSDVEHRMGNYEAQIKEHNSRIQTLAERPEAPAMARYTEVLHQLEDVQHQCRTLDLRLDETLESVRRTQNKLAARSKRDAAPSVESQIGELTEPAPVPPANRQRIPFGGR
jgi:chromosome segregation ATPase